MNFTHLSHKTSHITPSKTVYIYTFTTVTVYTIILLISQFRTFFSLSSPCKTNSVSDFSSPHLLFPQIHTNTPTQTHPHRQINTKIHKHTHTDKPTKRQIGASVGCLWISGSILVALDQSSCVIENGSVYLWISVGSQDQCLWVDENVF